MPMPKADVQMPSWMELLEPVGPTPSARARRADAHPRPWLRKKPTTLHNDMKSIINDFQKRSEMSGIKERISAGAPPVQSRHSKPSPAHVRSPLVRDQMLARDITITDMQARINQLKRNVSAEKCRFDREIVEVHAKVKEMEDREIELGAQNAFLRQAILDGRMGEEIDTKLFEELYDDLVKVDKDEDMTVESDDSSDALSEDLAPKSADSFCIKPDRSSPSRMSMRHAATLMQDAGSFVKATASSLGSADGNLALVTKIQPPRPGGLTRTLSATVENFVANTYDPAVPMKIKRSTSHRNVLLPPSPVQARSPLTRLHTALGPGKSPKIVSPLRKIQSSATLPREPSSNGSRPLSPKRSFRSTSQTSSPLLSPMTAQRQALLEIRPSSSDWSETESSMDGHMALGIESFEEKHNTLLLQYINMLMECHHASPGLLPMDHMTGSEAEFLKRQPIVLEELSAILAGSEDFGRMCDTIDTADAKCRVDMVNVLARQLKFVGKLVHAMYSVKELSTLPMDPSVSCDLFVEDIKKHVGCKNVRLWLVDEKNSYIWEHDPGQENPVKRRFVVSGGTSQSSDPENMAMQALQYKPDSDQPLRLSTDVLCEPVRYKGAVVAVIQCFLDDEQEETASFTQVDQLQLSFICQMAGVIFQRMFLFQDSMWSVERALRMFALTSHYPCNARELFALTTIQLRPVQNILGASLCLVYLTAGHGLKERRMWTRRVDGIDTTVEVAYGAGIAGWVAEEEAPVVSNDVENDKRFDFVLDTAYAAGLSAKSRIFLVSSLLAVPMKRQDGTLFGVCTMINRQGEGSPFNRADLRLLELHCELAMLSYKETLLEDCDLTPYETIPEALRRIKMLLRVEWSLYFKLAEDKTKLTLESPIRLGVPIDDMLLGYVARTGVTVATQDASSDPRFNSELGKTLGSKIQALLCLPVQGDKDTSKLHGVLFIANRIAGSSVAEFDEEDVSMAEVLSRQIGQMISANPQQGLSPSSYRNQTTMQDMERMQDLARHNITVTNVAER